MRSAVATASLIEAFLSLQGEGPQVGQPTLFVRSAGCPLRCSYCDTVYSYAARSRCEVRDLHGRTLAVLDNPAGAADVLGAVPEAALRGVRWVSFTGGEPLLFPGFGVELFQAARERGLRAHLETAALDPAALEALLPHTDHLAMDWKLPSALPSETPSAEHEACLAAAVAAGVDTAVKIVVTPSAGDREWRQALRALARYRARIRLVLQPVTPCLHESAAPDPRRVLELAGTAMAAGFELLVLPQVHKHLGIA